MPTPCPAPADLPFDIVELVACPPEPAATDGTGRALRESPFRHDAWTPDEIGELRQLHAADRPWDEIALLLDRPVAGIKSKAYDLGLRRSSALPWTTWDDDELTGRYQREPTSELALRIGRTPTAIYARARILGLQESGPLPYSAWEVTQVREGYARGVPIAQLAALIGRPASGIPSVAARLKLRHAAGPPDWTAEEQQRALALANEGHSYRAIAAQLGREGFPARTKVGIGSTLRALGHARGWGRPWTPEEDALLQRTYQDGASLTPLRDRLARTASSVAWRVRELGLAGTHPQRHGWRTDPAWSNGDLERLRREYGRTPTRDLARSLGRKLRAVYSKAHTLGLVHDYIRAFAPAELAAIRIAHAQGVSLTDLAAALGRDPSVVSKHASRALGLSFQDRPNPGPKTRRANRTPLTLAGILALEPAASSAIERLP
jgi:hypothetical protein